MNSLTAAGSTESFTIQELADDRVIQAGALQLRERFERDGILIAPDFLTESELAPLRHELNAYYAPFTTTLLSGEAKEQAKKTDCDVIPWDPVGKGNAVFGGLAANARLAKITRAVLGEGFTSPGSLVMFSVGGGRGQAWHQDCPTGEDHGFNLNRLFYTDNVTYEDGALVFVPGSHRLGRISAGGAQEPIAGEKMLTPQSGTLVLLHGHVYHRVTPNLNLKPRVSVNFRAFPAGVDQDVTCVGVYRNGTVNFCDQPKQHDGTPAMVGAMR